MLRFGTLASARGLGRGTRGCKLAVFPGAFSEPERVGWLIRLFDWLPGCPRVKIETNPMASKRASQLRQRYRHRKVRARITRIARLSNAEDEDRRTFLLPQKVHVAIIVAYPSVPIC
jgi:hypothetical protein